jgi:hypothetical protein
VEADMEVSWDLLDEEVTIDLAPFILMLWDLSHIFHEEDLLPTDFLAEILGEQFSVDTVDRNSEVGASHIKQTIVGSSYVGDLEFENLVRLAFVDIESPLKCRITDFDLEDRLTDNSVLDH